MTTRSRRIYEEVRNLLDYLINAELALYANPIRDEGHLVTWRASGGADEPFLAHRGLPTARLYRRWVEIGAYSALLYDGSLLQITFDLRGDVVVGHRLAYVPCPFDVDPDYLLTGAISEVIDLYADGETSDVVLRSAVRFDYDPLNARDNHPATHLTFNGPDCRIACAGPLRLGHYVEFVFANFYPWLWDVHPYLQKLAKKTVEGRTLSDADAAKLHVTWREALASAT